LRQQVIAKRYARALFAIGQEAGDAELKAYGDELASLADVLRGAPQLLKIFNNPIVKTEDKKGVAQKILSRISAGKTVSNFCMFLADKGRLGAVLEIQQYFASLLDLKEGILRGKVVTAIDLASGKQDAIKKELEKQLDQTLVLEYEADTSILGGLVLKVGDKVYDASLRAQLDQMKETIKRGE
jgi:F-type H+-transporting ATPase subunit delta